jgi:hypothetical protein
VEYGEAENMTRKDLNRSAEMMSKQHHSHDVLSRAEGLGIEQAKALELNCAVIGVDLS